MKNLTGRYLLLLVCLLSGIDALCQSPSGDNYIRERIFTDVNGGAFLESTAYHDGLGYPSEYVQTGITPFGADLVTLTKQDAMGNDSCSWLPAAVQGNCGHYTSSELLAQSIGSTYADRMPFQLTVHEKSPLNRVVAQMGAGETWYVNKRAATSQYFHNSLSNEQLKCRCYTALPLSDSELNIHGLGYYQAGELNAVCTQDEDGHQTITFTNDRGQTILVRSCGGGQSFADTYYIYDTYDNLVAVLPPAAAGQMQGQTVWNSQTSDVVKQYAYLYRYDDRHRCTAKRLPGCEWTYYVYDDADRMIFFQDGNQRQQGVWAFSIPDIFGRVCLTGTCKGTSDVEGKVVTAHYTGETNDYKGYALTNVSVSSPSVLTVNYYDSYDFLGSSDIPHGTLNYEQADGFGERWPNAKMLQTGSAVAVLDGAATPTYLYTAMYYDDRGRIILQKSTNILGGTESTCTKYDFTGHPLKKRHVHTAQGKDTQTELYTYTYDHAGRLLTTSYRLNGNAEVTLASNSYDELGRLKSTIRHGSSTLKTDYDYNVRNWTTKVESPLFKEQLYYNTSHHGSTPQWGGMVSAMDWQTDNVARGYRFLYDGFSRLTQADYMEGGSTNAKYDTRYTYDLMGNMLTLERNGKQDGGSYGPIDDVTFTYNGNQLVKADDAADDPTYAGVFNFRDGSSEEQEYEYDANGNMTKDANKRISSITYNLLNLPQRIYFETKTIENIVYSADGRKLRATYTFPPMRYMPPKPPRIKVVKTDYCDNVIYQDGKLSQILVDGGYITFSGTTPVYHYYLKDHLGNNRVVAKSDGTVEQVNHYYPFGGLMAESTGGDIQRYKYNGKELDRMFGLDWYDYGARHYDGVRAQFTTFDPLAEKDYGTSPYAYCGNAPIIRVDRDGRIWDTVIDVAFVAYDLADAGVQYINNGSVSNTTKAALAADALAAVIPGVTGAGLAVRSGAKAASKVDNAITSTSKVVNGIKSSKNVTNAPKGRRGTTIAKKNGVTIETYGSNDVHKPAHAHVKGKGKHVRIGPNGKPLKGQPELSNQQKM